MKKNIVITLLVFASVMFLVFAYTKEIQVEKSVKLAAQFQRVDQESQASAQQAMERAKIAEQEAHKQVILAQQQLKRCQEKK